MTIASPPRIDRVATAVTVARPDVRRVSVEFWPGDGAPLVLLHGLLDCAAGWKRLAAAIDRPCYAIDLPGFGDSDLPPRNRISAYVEDVQAVLAALDVHDFTLVGHSLGGAVAAGLVERLGDDVAALVLIAPAGFGRIHLAERPRPARPARSPRRCHDRLSPSSGQRLEEHGPPSPERGPSELARFIEGACDRGRTSVRDAASGPNPLLTRVSGAAITPQSLRDDAAGDFPAVA
jgi:pimeloyl-ACP methyl ester carboxylesterase